MMMDDSWMKGYSENDDHDTTWLHQSLEMVTYPMLSLEEQIPASSLKASFDVKEQLSKLKIKNFGITISIGTEDSETTWNLRRIYITHMNSCLRTA